MGKNWKALKEGEIVDVIAPAYGISKQGLEKAKEYISSIGLVPRVPSDILGEDLFCSNADEIRLKHLKDALYANDSKAIWCLKGGYGTARILHHLEEENAPTKPKAVIGFSDITSLHLFLTQKWEWNSVHGSVLWQLSEKKINNESIEKLKNLIFGKEKEQKFKLIPLNKRFKGNIKASVTGGNLMLIQSSIATSWQMDANNKIVLLEDVDEKAYRIDRMLLHLNQSGILNGAKAIIFGDFTGEGVIEKDVDSVLKRFAEEFAAPVFRAKGIGHDSINNPLPLGTKAVIYDNILKCESGFNV